VGPHYQQYGFRAKLYELYEEAPSGKQLALGTFISCYITAEVTLDSGHMT